MFWRPTGSLIKIYNWFYFRFVSIQGPFGSVTPIIFRDKLGPKIHMNCLKIDSLDNGNWLEFAAIPICSSIINNEMILEFGFFRFKMTFNYPYFREEALNSQRSWWFFSGWSLDEILHGLTNQHFYNWVFLKFFVDAADQDFKYDIGLDKFVQLSFRFRFFWKVDRSHGFHVTRRELSKERLFIWKEASLPEQNKLGWKSGAEIRNRL